MTFPAQPASSGGKKIALLLPETKTARYESQDRPLFEAVKQLCSDCQVIYSNADQDAAQQQSQAEAALTNGAKVLVLDAGRRRSAAAIANKAKQQNVPVIAYDRLITDTPTSTTTSRSTTSSVGELQGQALVEGAQGDGNESEQIVMINGSPTDNNATLFKQGAHSVLDGKVTIAKDTTRPTGARTRPRTRWTRRSPPLGNDARRRLRRQRRHRPAAPSPRMKARRRQAHAAGDRPGRRARRRSSASSPATST